MTGQYVATREIKLLLDRWHCPPWLSLMVACGLAGVSFSSLQYNWVIQDTYAYHGFPPPPLDGGFLRIKVAPGLAWCFMRAGCGTGGALYFGPSMTARVQQFPCHAGYEELPSQLARLGGGPAPLSPYLFISVSPCATSGISTDSPGAYPLIS